MRQKIGVTLLAASILYSLVDLAGSLHPALLRLRAAGGLQRTFAIGVGSLTFKAILLFTGGLLAFWPQRWHR